LAQGVSDCRVLFYETFCVKNAKTRYTGLSYFYIAMVIVIFEDAARYCALAVRVN
jgi:hypothetical protein